MNLLGGIRLRTEIMVFSADSNSVAQASIHVGNDTDMLGDSFNPSISDDGRWIVYESRSIDLVTNQLNGADRNVFLFDRETQTTTLVNTNATGAAAAGSVSTSAAISGDGKWTVFFSDASDLVADDTNATGDIFLRNNQTGAITLVSSQSQWHGLVVRNAIKPVISSAGEWILYQAPSSGLFLYQRSLNQNTLITTDCEADPASMTPDAGLVAFTASAKAINSASLTTARNVYVWTSASGSIDLITRRNAAYRRALPDTDTRLTQGGIDASGIRFVFRSAAKNLIPNQTDAYDGLWVRDNVLNKNMLVAQYDENYRSAGPRPFSEAVISGSGRYVAYLSPRTNLPPEGLALDGWNDIFVHDLQTGFDQLITTSRTGSFQGSSNSFSLTINNDGSRVGFLSYSTNLTTNGDGQPGFYLWDRASNLIRRMDDAGTGNLRSAVPSPDGSRVVFEASFGGTTGNLYDYLFVRSWEAQQSTLLPLNGITELAWSADSQHLAVIAHNQPHWIDLSDGINIKSPDTIDSATGEYFSNVGISADGSSVSFVWVSSVANNPWQIWNPLTGALSSPPVSGLYPDAAFRQGGAAISSDGRYLAFRAGRQPSLTTDSYVSPEYRWHIHVWDRVNGTVTIADQRLAEGFPGNLAPPADLGPVKFAFAPDSSRLFFQSTQPDAAPMDSNLSRDVFYADFLTYDSDQDGMDDEWEMAYFNTLDRDGSGDMDGDGVSDLSEFQAGTIPINSNSVLSVTKVIKAGTNQIVLYWQSAVGRHYVVERKENIDATGSSWQAISDVITASTETSFFIDSIGTATGATKTSFYRVKLVP